MIQFELTLYYRYVHNDVNTIGAIISRSKVVHVVVHHSIYHHLHVYITEAKINIFQWDYIYPMSQRWHRGLDVR